jgi:hypothetical protein
VPCAVLSAPRRIAKGLQWHRFKNCQRLPAAPTVWRRSAPLPRADVLLNDAVGRLGPGGTLATGCCLQIMQFPLQT